MRMLGPFYSSEVLPPFLVEQVSSLQSKSHPCRASFILAEQASSLQSKPHPCRASFILVEQVSSLQSKPHPCRASFLKLGGQVWVFVLSGAHTKDGLYLLWACWARQALSHILSSSTIYFENLTIELHVLYVLNIHVKFCVNRILFTT